MTRYKLEERTVERNVFVKNSDISNVLKIWEKAVETYKKEFETAHASVIFCYSRGKFTVLTETILLLKLYSEVKDNQIIASNTRKTSPLVAI